MTDVVEAMARGLVAWRYNQVLGRDDKIFALWKALNADLWAAAINGARAAIRAVTEAGGLVVEKMPEERITPDSVPWRYGDAWDGVQENADPEHLNDICDGYADGHNAALAAVRAAAVEVK